MVNCNIWEILLHFVNLCIFIIKIFNYYNLTKGRAKYRIKMFKKEFKNASRILK
jgi:hypothetical protein